MVFVTASIQLLLQYISTTLLLPLCQWLLGLSLLFTLTYATGWFHRFLWYSIEREASKVLNGTTVTVGSFDYAISIGKQQVWMSNVILHAPRRKKWKWESPVLARMGKVYVESNILYCIMSLWFFRTEIPLELYTVRLTDIQVFVERKMHIFNFYLMDPHVDVPDPEDSDNDDDDDSDANGDDENHAEETIDTSLAWENSQTQRTSGSGNTGATGNNNSTLTNSGNTEAQKLIEDMVRALGRAAKQGSLQVVLAEHRRNLTSTLRAWQQNTKKSQAMQQGVNIVKQVSIAVVEKTQTVQQVVQPARRKLQNEKIVYGRVGRVLIEDMRVFTRDHLDDETKTNVERANDINSNGVPAEYDADKKKSKSRSKSTTTAWNKPIYIQKVAVRASELCAPLSAKDEEGLPVLYQSMDKMFEVIWKRVLAEIAKTNTGRLLETAMGEVLDYWKEQELAVGNASSHESS